MNKQLIFSKLVLDWYQNKGRKYPWRQDISAFEALTAGLLLQRTNANSVSKVYKNFLKKYPSPERVLDTPIDEVVKDFSNLGYSKRALIYMNICRYIMDELNGIIPEEEEKLLKIPGIGLYIANSIRCIAYGIEVPMVDTNVIRVISRVFSIECYGDSRIDSHIWDFIKSLTSIGISKYFNWGLIDIGGLFCRTKNPKCIKCPLSSICDFYDALSTRRDLSV